MIHNPIAYWRQVKKEKQLLGKWGKIVTLTYNQDKDEWIGIIQGEDFKVAAGIVANFSKPRIGDEVVGVLRLVDNSNPEDLIYYGVKFLLKAENY
jgi:uncharacterized OB-fold protein